jgi:hypothetical protein
MPYGLPEGNAFIDSMLDLVSCRQFQCECLSRLSAWHSSCRFGFCKVDVIGGDDCVPRLHLCVTCSLDS